MTASAAPARRPGRAATTALWILQGLCAVIYLGAAYPKITLDPLAVAGFEQLGLGPTGCVIVGLLEVAAAIAMFVPRLTGLAATCCIALMIGAVISTLATMPAPMAVLPAVVGVFVTIIAWARRDSTVALLRDLRAVIAR